MHTAMFVVDKIIKGIIICENIETGEMSKFKYSEGIVEGDVIKIVDNKVVVDHEYTRIRKNRILDKVSRL